MPTAASSPATTRRALIWYIAAAQAAHIGPRTRTIEEVGDEIGSGTVAVQMLRPVSVVGLRMSSELGEALVRVRPPPSWRCRCCC